MRRLRGFVLRQRSNQLVLLNPPVTEPERQKVKMPSLPFRVPLLAEWSGSDARAMLSGIIVAIVCLPAFLTLVWFAEIVAGCLAISREKSPSGERPERAIGQRC